MNPLGEFLLGAVEVAQELLVGERFLQGVEVGAVQVLQERVAEERVVVGPADDGRDRFLARHLGSAEPTLTHDQLEVLGGHFTYNDGLQHAELANGGGQLAQVVLVKDVTRLPGIGDDLVQRQLDEIGAVPEPV